MSFIPCDHPDETHLLSVSFVDFVPLDVLGFVPAEMCSDESSLVRKCAKKPFNLNKTTQHFKKKNI